MASSDAFKYWAFISYSHADRVTARALARAIEGYRLPARLGPDPARTLPRRLLPVFRDRDEFSGSADLGAAVEQALHQSRALIVLCSPAARTSTWVNTEIRLFRQIRGAKRIFAVLVDGTPENAFPSELVVETDDGVTPNGIVHEPLAIDARPRGALRDARLRVVAAILEIEYDALRRRDAVRRRRRAWQLGAAALALALVLASAAAEVYRTGRLSRAHAMVAAGRAALPARPDLARTLAVEADGIAPSAESHALLIDSLETAPRLEADLRHALTELAVDPRGAHAAGFVETTGSRGSVTLWDLRRRPLTVQTLAPPLDHAGGFSFSPSGNTLFAAYTINGRREGAGMWRLDRDAVMRAVPLRLPAGQHVAGMISDHELVLADDRGLSVVEIDAVPAGRARRIPIAPGEDSALSADGTRLAVARNGAVFVYDLTRPQNGLRTACRYEPPGAILQLSADARRLLVWDDFGGVMTTCAAAAGPATASASRRASRLANVAISADGSQVAQISDEAGTVSFFDGKTLLPTGAPDAAVGRRLRAARYAGPRGELFAYGPGTPAKLVDAASVQPLAHRVPFDLRPDVDGFVLTETPPRLLAWRRSGTSLVDVSIVDASSGRLVYAVTVSAAKGEPELGLRPDGSAFTFGDGRRLLVFDLRRDRASPVASIGALPGARLGPCRAALSPNGRDLVWLAAEGKLMRRSLRPDAPMQTAATTSGLPVFTCEGGPPVFSADGRRFAIDHGGTSFVFDAQTLALRGRVDPQGDADGSAYPAVFSADGKRLVVASGTWLRFYDVERGALAGPAVHVIDRQYESITGLTYLRDGSAVVYTSSRGWMGWIDARTLQPIGTAFSDDPLTGFASTEIFPSDDARPLAVAALAGDLMLTVDRRSRYRDRGMDWRRGAFVWRLDRPWLVRRACENGAFGLSAKERLDAFGDARYVPRCERAGAL